VETFCIPRRLLDLAHAAQGRRSRRPWNVTRRGESVVSEKVLAFELFMQLRWLVGLKCLAGFSSEILLFPPSTKTLIIYHAMSR